MSVSTVQPNPLSNAASWVTNQAKSVAGSLSDTATRVKAAVVNFFSYVAARIAAFYYAAKNVAMSGFSQVRASFSALPSEGQWAVGAAAALVAAVSVALGRYVFGKKPETKVEATLKDGEVKVDVKAPTGKADASATTTTPDGQVVARTDAQGAGTATAITQPAPAQQPAAPAAPAQQPAR